MVNIFYMLNLFPDLFGFYSDDSKRLFHLMFNEFIPLIIEIKINPNPFQAKNRK